MQILYLSFAQWLLHRIQILSRDLKKKKWCALRDSRWSERGLAKRESQWELFVGAQCQVSIISNRTEQVLFHMLYLFRNFPFFRNPISLIDTHYSQSQLSSHPIFPTLIFCAPTVCFGVCKKKKPFFLFSFQRFRK